MLLRKRSLSNARPVSIAGKGVTYHLPMSNPPDLAQIRFNNALALFDEFVHSTIKHADAATLRGLEGRFAQKVQIQPSYWSQIKSRARQIGERLARQFERLCKKPNGWMDQARPPGALPVGQLAAAALPGENPIPQDDDERFIVGLVLTYYRRHPQRARTQLLDILGEVLSPNGGQSALSAKAGLSAAAKLAQGGETAAKADVTTADIHALWLQSQAGVAPLRQKK